MLEPAAKATSKSMLSFDLRRDSGQMEKSVQDELIVVRNPGKRRSSGRHTLQSFISRKLALQAGADALKKREPASKQPLGTKLASNSSNKSDAPHSPKKVLHPERVTKSRLIPPRRSHSSRVSETFIPMGQDGDIPPNEDVVSSLSQTQIYVSPGKFTPSKIYSPLPFMATPPTVRVRDRARSPRLEGIAEESEEESDDAPRRKPVKKPVRSLFLDIEASESSEGGSGDEGEESDASDISGLIASGTLESDEEDVHRKLHAQWEREQDAKEINLARISPEGIRRKRKVDAPVKNTVITNAHVPLRKRKLPKPAEKPLPTTTLTKNPGPTYVTRKPTYTTRNRRSSVSQGSDAEVRIIRSASAPTGLPFSFIKPPPEESAKMAIQRQEAQQTMREQAAAPQRLNGAERFVFGNTSHSK